MSKTGQEWQHVKGFAPPPPPSPGAPIDHLISHKNAGRNMWKDGIHPKDLKLYIISKCLLSGPNAMSVVCARSAVWSL